MGECGPKRGWALTFKHFSSSVEYSPLAIFYKWVSMAQKLVECCALTFKLFSCSVEYLPLAILYNLVSVAQKLVEHSPLSTLVVLLSTHH